MAPATSHGGHQCHTAFWAWAACFFLLKEPLENPLVSRKFLVPPSGGGMVPMCED